MYSAIAGAVMWWSMYSIFGSECGGSLLIPAFSGTEMSIRRRGMPYLHSPYSAAFISFDGSAPTRPVSPASACARRKS